MQELITQMSATLELIKEENEKTSKAAQGRARKASSDLKKLADAFRKASLEESKK